MVDKKKLTDNEIEEKINEFKVQLLNTKGKRKQLKKEIARLLTSKTKNNKEKTN